MEMADREFERISDDQAREHLKETYQDPEAAAKFFDGMIEARTAAVERFTEEVSNDEALAGEFARNPLGMLHDRKLVGPLDQITLEDLRNPFLDWPWPWPICRIQCNIESYLEWTWICVGIWPIRLCWPVLQIRFRWVCRIVCD